jgi:hypothetical protein
LTVFSNSKKFYNIKEIFQQFLQEKYFISYEESFIECAVACLNNAWRWKIS